MNSKEWIAAAGAESTKTVDEALSAWSKLPETIKQDILAHLRKRLDVGGSMEMFLCAIRLAPQSSDLFELLLNDFSREDENAQYFFLKETEERWPKAVWDHYMDLIIQDLNSESSRAKEIRALRFLFAAGPRARAAASALQRYAGTRDSELLGLALKAAGRMGKDMLSFIEQGFNSRLVDVLRAALGAIEYQDLDDKDVQDVLQKLYNHPNEEVARGAAKLLLPDAKTRTYKPFVLDSIEIVNAPSCCGVPSTRLAKVWDSRELVQKWPAAFAALRTALKNAANDDDELDHWKMIVGQDEAISGKISDQGFLDALEGREIRVFQCSNCQKTSAIV